MAGQQRYADPEKLVRALRVIRTWAEFDLHGKKMCALSPDDVVALCDKTLAEWSDRGGCDE